MSNMLPNPYNNAPGPVQGNVNRGPQVFNHNPLNQVPSSQLPPGYGSKPDPNSNSPIPSVPQKSVISQVQNVNYNQSGNSSPAFNQPGMMPPPVGLQSSPLHPIKTAQNPMLPPSSSASPMSMSNNTSPYPSNFISQPQINANAPPLVPSSQYTKPLLNGPTLFTQPPNQNVPMSSNLFSAPSVTNNPINTLYAPRPVNQTPQGSAMPLAQVTSQSGALFTGSPVSSLPRNSPQVPGPPISGPLNAQPLSAPPPVSGPPTTFGINGPGSQPGQTMPFPGQVRPPMAAPRPPIQPPLGPPANQPYSGMPINGPPNSSQGFPAHPRPPVSVPYIPGPMQNIPQTGQQSYQPLTQHVGPPIVPPGPPAGPTSGPTSNMQNRYPQMQHSAYGNQQPPMPPGMSNQYPQYNEQGVTQQMGQLSVTRQGFDQLWGHQLVDLMQSRHILPEYPDDPPEIRLGHQFADAPNCSPEIFRCTVNRIPESNSLLQKSRLPLGILIHPFKDLNHLPVIQCATIVRCRACRTYINPFVYFVDSKRWKCNLCYRVNDLPEEFQYDPVSKSYGEPSRRPEVKSATIEFIAPGEYMLRPPQPAVYLFLLDVSQLARESGYLQVFCETLREHLEQLPGDARTQVGFICYDAHVHFYLLGDGLARPKEMTVLDIEDVFLPSPSSLLVNLGERRELVLELLGALPQRHAAPAPPACALGAALQAAYKLMAPTGGRITVLQTCLPNVGPGALKSREDPNARSAAAVEHLSPATDFYKRLALECSGAQVAVDLFLLNSQYCDLATLSGMSQFSAGSVHHIPLFRASAAPLALRLRRQLSRYLTRKIGFEAVMRVRTTRGISIHTFHGNFFVRSTDLLSLPNVSPDAGFGMQLSIDESLADLQQVCFQAALLYTSSKGERRIRVHTLALPIANTLPEVLHSADQQCIIGLLSKMAVDRCVSASLGEAREALSNVGVDALSALRLAHPAHARAHPGLPAPLALRLLPLYLNALLKRKAFRTGTSTRLDDRVFDMCSLKSQPLGALLRGVYPDLYPVHALRDHERDGDHDGPDPPRLHLTAERVNSTGAYLLDDGETMVVYVGHGVSAAFLAETWGADSFAALPDGLRAPPAPASPLAALLDRLNEDRPYPADLLLLKDNSPSKNIFTDRLVDDRVESSFSYYEFLQHLKSQVK